MWIYFKNPLDFFGETGKHWNGGLSGLNFRDLGLDHRWPGFSFPFAVQYSEACAQINEMNVQMSLADHKSCHRALFQDICESQNPPSPQNRNTYIYGYILEVLCFSRRQQSFEAKLPKKGLNEGWARGWWWYKGHRTWDISGKCHPPPHTHTLTYMKEPPEKFHCAVHPSLCPFPQPPTSSSSSPYHHFWVLLLSAGKFSIRVCTHRMWCRMCVCVSCKV